MVFSVVLLQMGVFFLIVIVGMAASRLGVVKRDYLKELASLVSKVFLPALIFYMTYHGTTRQQVLDNVPMIALAAGFYVVVSAIMKALALLLKPKGDRQKVFRFAFIFGNTGFVGIPLLAALYPESGLLYMALFSIVDQLLFWTYGVYLATASDRRARFGLRQLASPNIVAIVLALVFVLAGVQLPGLVMDVLDTVSGATTALCMVYLGCLFYYSNWGVALKAREVYAGIAVKMVLLPVVLGRLLFLTGLPEDMVVSMIVIMALPTMTVVPMVAAAHGNEGEYAAGVTVVTLASCIVTLPFVVLLATG